MGQIIKLREYPDASFRDVTAPNADTLYTTVVLRRRQGAVGAQHAGHEGPLLPVPDAGRLDDVFQVPGKRTTGTGAQTYAITGPGWKGTLPAGVQGIQVADQHRLAARPHLLHRHAGGLRGRPQAAGRVQARSAELLRQALYAAGRKGGSVDRHEDRRARAGQQDGCGRVFHAALQTHEGQSADRRGRAPRRALREDRDRARSGFRRRAS